MSSFTHWPALRMYPGSQTHPSEQGPVHWFGGNGLQEGWQTGAHDSKWLLGGHFRAGEEECVLVLIINFTLSGSMRNRTSHWCQQVLWEFMVEEYVFFRHTTEGAVSPGSNCDTTVLTFIDVWLYCFTQCRMSSIQFTHIKQTGLEETLYTQG